MPYPSLTFAQLLNNLTREELEHLISQFVGYLSAQHNENGEHTAITADSITAEGDGTFGGNVTADSDGNPVEMGTLPLTSSNRPVAGLDMEGNASSQWRFGAFTAATGATPARELILVDLLSSGDAFTARLFWDTGNSRYAISPGTGVTVQFGDATLGRLGSYHSSGHFYGGSSSAAYGEWTAFSPSWTNVTVGDGTVTARKTTTNKRTRFYIRFVLGSTSSITGSVIVSVPGTIHASMAGTGVRAGNSTYRDNSAGQAYSGLALVNTNTTIALFSNASPVANVNGTVPFTWAQDDILFIEGEYEEA